MSVVLDVSPWLRKHVSSWLDPEHHAWTCGDLPMFWRHIATEGSEVRFVAWDGEPEGKFYTVELWDEHRHGEDIEPEGTEFDIVVDYDNRMEACSVLYSWISQILNEHGLDEVCITLERY